MFSIELEIPCDDEKSLDHIVYHENLDKVINSSREDVLDPHLRTEMNVEVIWFWVTSEEVLVISVDVLEL